MTQYARPTSDVSNTGWGTAPLWSKVDEAVADDADLISASSSGNVCEVGMGSVTDPNGNTGHKITIRRRSGGGHSCTIALVQGTTVIASFTDTTAGGTFTDTNYTLSSSEADAITNYADLRLRFTLGASVNYRISQAFFETPDAAITGVVSQTLANVTISATGQVAVQGSAGINLAGVSLAGAGQVLVDGTLGQTLGPVVLAGTGLVLVNGALVQTLASAGLSATGTVGNSTINGNLSQALASVSLVGVGQVAVQGALAQTLAVVTLLAWGGSGVLLSVDVADAAVYLAEAGDRAVFAVVLGDALVYDVSLSDGD